MNMSSTTSRTALRHLVTVGALGLILTTVAATSAHAGDRRQNAARKQTASSYTHRHQGDYTRQTEVKRTDNGHLRTDTWTGAQGTATRQERVVNDRANLTHTKEVDWTGPKGGTKSRDTLATWDPATKTWTRDVTVDRTPPPASDGG
jgi:hypothetical protein